MQWLKMSFAVLTIVAVGALVGCSATTEKSVDVSASIRAALDQAGLKAVSVSQDRDKGIVTLGGQVGSEGEKAQAGALTQSLAGEQVVANQIAVVLVGAESDAKTVNADLDKGIEQNLDAALIQNKMHDSVKYAVKNAVVTLTGEVASQQLREAALNVAAVVPNVKQVVNDLQVKNQKATSTR